MLSSVNFFDLYFSTQFYAFQRFYTLKYANGNAFSNSAFLVIFLSDGGVTVLGVVIIRGTNIKCVRPIGDIS